jgi:hypothetical protein
VTARRTLTAAAGLCAGVVLLMGAEGCEPVAYADTAAPVGTAQKYAYKRMQRAPYNWSRSEWPALKTLWIKESGWRSNAVNSSSGACGIPQAYPCSKIRDRSMKGQVNWGLRYIDRRYGTPTEALRQWRNRCRTDGHCWY